MKWKEFSVLTKEVCAEAIAGVFHNMGSGGVLIEDPQAARKYLDREEWQPDPIAEDFRDSELVAVKAYFPEDTEVMDELAKSLRAVECNFHVKCKVFVDELRNEDWEENWKQYYHTFKIGERLVIKPSWEEYTPTDQEVVVNIDPGMAFGTGIHASTRFCLNFLEQYIEGGEHIVDAGCGSGILSIAAAKLGAQSVFAMDIDDVAVRVARENVALNGLEERIIVASGDITEEIPSQTADMVMANITAEVIAGLIPAAARVIRPDGYLFASGLVENQWPEVKAILEANGLEIEQVLQDVDWIGVAARKLDDGD